MRLSSFIRSNEETIIAEWEKFARSVPVAEKMNRTQLRDHIVALLAFIAEDLESHQGEWEQSEKSKGRSDGVADNNDTAGEKHAEQRFSSGFDTIEMISEFRALRASVTKLWSKSSEKTDQDFKDIVRFNESIDQIMAESLVRYTEIADEARTLFLGTLIHDLRNPLNAVLMSAQLLPRSNNLDERQVKLVSQIEISTVRITELVSMLIDEVRIRLGKGLPISPVSMDMKEMIEQSIKEIKAAHPERNISLTTEGNLQGEWDYDRLSQVLSNLIGNAIQYGLPEEPIHVEAKENPEGVSLSVQNKGTPIPSALLPQIFDPLTRGAGKAQLNSKANSMGLGLFITKGIIESHGGRIKVKSNSMDGTIFTAQLPRVAKSIEEVVSSV